MVFDQDNQSLSSFGRKRNQLTTAKQKMLARIQVIGAEFIGFLRAEP